MPNAEPALWATQGGGLATEVNGLMVWYEVPDEFPEFLVCDPIPPEWGTVPINEAARRATDG